MDKDVITQDIEYHRNKKTLKLKTNKEITIDLDKLKKHTVQFRLDDTVAPHYFILDNLECDFDSSYPASYKLTLEFREVWHGTK